MIITEHARDVNPTKTFYVTPPGNYLLKVGVRYTRVLSIFATLGSLTPILSKSLPMGTALITILLFYCFILPLYIKLS